MLKSYRGAPVGTLAINTASTHITTAAQVQLGVLSSACTECEILNFTQSAFQIFTKGINSSQINALPYTVGASGSSGVIHFKVHAGTTLYLQAIDQAATSGMIILNFFTPELY